MFSLSKKEIETILNSENIFAKYFELAHCNLKRTNKLNLYYNPNKYSEEYIYVFTRNGWQLKKTKDILDRIIYDMFDNLRDYISQCVLLSDVYFYKAVNALKNCTMSVLRNQMAKLLTEIKLKVELIYKYHKSFMTTDYVAGFKSKIKILDKISDLESESDVEEESDEESD